MLALFSRDELAAPSITSVSPAAERRSKDALVNAVAASKLGDAKKRDTVIARLVQHFSKLNLRNEDHAEPDMLGRACEYLNRESSPTTPARRAARSTRRSASTTRSLPAASADVVTGMVVVPN